MDSHLVALWKHLHLEKFNVIVNNRHYPIQVKQRVTSSWYIFIVSNAIKKKHTHTQFAWMSTTCIYLPCPTFLSKAFLWGLKGLTFIHLPRSRTWAHGSTKDLPSKKGNDHLSTCQTSVGPYQMREIADHCCLFDVGFMAGLSPPKSWRTPRRNKALLRVS